MKISGRLQVCATQSNCISTSSIKSLDKYGLPWIIPTNEDPEDSWKTLVANVKADSVMKVVDVDNERHYLRAEAKSMVPISGTDDVEFFLPYLSDRMIFYRSNSREVVKAGPQLVIGDAGSHKNRLERIRVASKFTEMAATTGENQKYLEDFKNLNFFEQQQYLSMPSDVNFLDNDVPAESNIMKDE